MDAFTIIDAVVAVVILLSAILAYARGLVREVMAILGWVAAAVVAYIFAPDVQPLMTEIPYIGGFLGDSCELAIIAAFAALFALTLVVVSLFTPVFSSFMRGSALGGVDQGLGFLFGVARGILLVVVAFVVYDRMMADEAVPMVDNSRTAVVFGNIETSLDERIPDNAPAWITRRYEGLVGDCGAGTSA